MDNKDDVTACPEQELTTPCGVCYGSGWHYVEDPSGAREDYGWPGTEGPRYLEKYCDCPVGERLRSVGG